MSTRSTPEIFTREEIHERTREYCRTTKKTIFTAEDITWTFPGRDNYRRKDVPTEWVMVKRDISQFMHSDEMLELYQQDSPDTPHASRRWTKRTHPIEEAERMKPKSAKRARECKHPLVRFHREVEMPVVKEYLTAEEVTVS